MRETFAVYRLTETALKDAGIIADKFNSLALECAAIAGTAPQSARCLACMNTHLELACFYAKKALALNPFNQA